MGVFGPVLTPVHGVRRPRPTRRGRKTRKGPPRGGPFEIDRGAAARTQGAGVQPKSEAKMPKSVRSV